MRSRKIIESDEHASPNAVVTLKHHRKMFCIHPVHPGLLIIQKRTKKILQSKPSDIENETEFFSPEDLLCIVDAD